MVNQAVFKRQQSRRIINPKKIEIMNYEGIENRIFDNHAAYNHYQSMQGMRQSECAIRPSLYISELKMKKAFKRLTDDEIKELFKQPNAGILGIPILREKLEAKLVDLIDWQTFVALIHLMKYDNYKCAEYVLKCSYLDVCPYETEEEIYLIIQSL